MRVPSITPTTAPVSSTSVNCICRAQLRYFGIMWTRVVLPLFAAAASASAQYSTPNSTTGPDADGKYTIAAEGIRAQFVPYAASISNLFINDTNGIERDIVLGFENASYYSVDPLHPHLGGVPGVFTRSCCELRARG